MQTVKMIDMDHYERIGQFNYFVDYANPYVGCTVSLDITEFMKLVREKKASFYHIFTYFVTHAANKVPEFRRRIKGNGIMEFSYCMASCTEMKENGVYAYCTLDCRTSLEQYLPYAKEQQQKARENGSIEEEREDIISFLFISCAPWMTYTALVQPSTIPADSNPRITWGKYFEQDGKIMIPVSVLVHHALADGLHISQFYDKLQEMLINKEAD